MTDDELKQYFLKNKDNKEAFYAYLDRKENKEKKVIISADELQSLPSNLQVELVAQRLKKKFNI
ncbi:DUF6887 family protein [Geminocystis sp. NIES-3709]|uniref:DUF6887 family protein n=1 Tax=Geminocystis sp. NIES-3709 TaxID=1617448 RepID=UPI0005FC9DF1|nr:hypothetical protein [Geminocystis sp. NIES-3709]BAQ66717.1 hypothetical protein GM3709_3482 [Geminocystis sp. NIES-3709]